MGTMSSIDRVRGEGNRQGWWIYTLRICDNQTDRPNFFFLWATKRDLARPISGHQSAQLVIPNWPISRSRILHGYRGWWSSGHRHRQLPRGSDLPAARQKVRVSPQPVSTEACPSLAHLSELDQPECGQDQTWTSTSGNQSRHDLSSFQGSIVCFPFSSIRCLCTQRSYTAQKKAGERRRWGCLNEWYGRSHGIIFR